MNKYFNRIFWFMTNILLCEFFQSSGSLCNVQLNKTRTCENCSSGTKPLLKGYHQTDKMSSVYGCVASKTLEQIVLPDIDLYEETHFIYVKDTSIKKVFLEIRDALPDSLLSHSRLSVKPRYSIVLVSPTPLKWIVSIKGNETDFILYVTSKSTVPSLPSHLIVPLMFSVTTSSGKPFHATQIKHKFCELYVCHLTSFFRLSNVDVIQLAVGAVNQSEIPKKCSLGFSLKKIGPTKKVAAFSLTELPPAEICASPVVSSSPYLFVLDFANCTRIRTVELKLIGVSSVPSNRNVYIILHSSMPLDWIVSADSNKDITTTINFVVSLNSSVNADDLAFSSDTGGIHIEHVPRMVSEEGKSLLEKVRSIYSISVSSYAKFANSPNRVEISFKDDSLDEITPVSTKKLDNLKFLLHYGISVTSRGAFFNLSRVILEAYELKISDFTVGNGSCNVTKKVGNFLFSDLSRCGLKRISLDDFTIEVAVQSVVTTIRFRFPKKKPRVQIFKDSSYSNVISDPIRFGKSRVVYADITATAAPKFGVNTQIKICFLTNQNHTSKHVLNINCPNVNNSIASSSLDKSIRFALNLTEDQFELSRNQLYNLTCVLTRCFQAARDPGSTLLDRCPQRSCQPVSNPDKHERFNETVSVQAFIYSTAPATKEGACEEHCDVPKQDAFDLYLSAFGCRAWTSQLLNAVFKTSLCAFDKSLVVGSLSWIAFGLITINWVSLFLVTLLIVLVLFALVVFKTVFRRFHAATNDPVFKAKFFYERSKKNGVVSDHRVVVVRSDVSNAADYNERCPSTFGNHDLSAGKSSVRGSTCYDTHRSDSSSAPNCGSTSTEETSLLTSSSASSEGDCAGKKSTSST